MKEYIDYLENYKIEKQNAKSKKDLIKVENKYIKLGFVTPHYERIKRNVYSKKQINNLIKLGVMPKRTFN